MFDKVSSSSEIVTVFLSVSSLSLFLGEYYQCGGPGFVQWHPVLF